MPPLFAETAKRFQNVIAKYPEFPKINVARYSLGMTLYRQGEIKNSLTVLSDVPIAERGGELGLTNFLIADCILRASACHRPG